METRTAVILGATSDMAAAFCHVLASKGWNLFLLGRNREKLEKMEKDLRIRYSNIQVSSLEFSVEKTDPEKIAVKLPEDFHVFASFIGYLGDQEKAQKDPEEAKTIMNVNYVYPVLFTEKIVEIMLKKPHHREKVIIGVSSVAGDRGRKSNYFYGSAKAGYTAYLSGLRNRLFSYGIHVLTVKPGFVYTAMTEHLTLPKLLTATPEEVARDIYRAMVKKKDILYTKWFWRYIMLVIKYLPEGIFKKLSL